MVCVSSAAQTPAVPLFGIGIASRVLPSGEVLFRAGDAKTHLYRVESGVICLYDPRWSVETAIVEFIFPGDFVGLGFLESHTLTACAFVETRVSCLPTNMEGAIVGGDRRAKDKLAQAVEREFEARRFELSDCGRMRPVERVASVLVNLSCSNRYEGRDPNVIVDNLGCGAFADMLDLDLDDLTKILLDLEHGDLIEPEPSGGLRLKNIAALEILADGKSESSSNGAWDAKVRPPKLPEDWPAAA